MPRKSSNDSIRSAATVFALMAATDEEFAAGVPLKNPKVIISGKKTTKAKKRKPKKGK